MYEDRIVASDLLFEMSRLINEKKITLIASDSTKEVATNNREIKKLVAEYSHTKLTKDEERTFSLLQDELKVLENKENSPGSVSSEELLKSIKKIDQYLYDLSKIQLEEGRRQVLLSEKAKENIDLFTQWEIIFLIIMAIFVQVIILYKPSRQ